MDSYNFSQNIYEFWEWTWKNSHVNLRISLLYPESGLLMTKIQLWGQFSEIRLQWHAFWMTSLNWLKIVEQFHWVNLFFEKTDVIRRCEDHSNYIPLFGNASELLRIIWWAGLGILNPDLKDLMSWTWDSKSKSESCFLVLELRLKWLRFKGEGIEINWI